MVTAYDFSSEKQASTLSTLNKEMKPVRVKRPKKKKNLGDGWSDG